MGNQAGGYVKGTPKATANLVARALPQLRIRLDINPNVASSLDEKIILYGGDYQAYSYKQVKSIKDDSIPGDTYVDLTFTGLIEDLLYWLLINPGKEGAAYFFFKALSYKQVQSLTVEE